MCGLRTIVRLVATIGLQPTYICLTPACRVRAYGDFGIIQLHMIQEHVWKIQ
jgi:hypothetical protein